MKIQNLEQFLQQRELEYIAVVVQGGKVKKLKESKVKTGFI